ncbi:MAG: CaiB/BaiF CoA transferase family protein [Dehalococcoidia bacterium]
MNSESLANHVTSVPPGALDGLRVIDLTHALAGPFCTMVLADLGADVLKVEPLHGDGTRKMGPFAPDDAIKAFGGYFNSVNRNKRSIVIDLQQPEGKAILRRLIAGADVLVENYRAGVMDRLGFSFESLHAEFPRLVYACVRGFGDPRTGDASVPESPYAAWPAFDVVAQAMGGLTGVTGPGPEQPMNAGAPMGDLGPALFAAVGILAAVRHAEHTGRGQLIDVAMYDGVLALCERIIYLHSYTGVVAGPVGAGNPQICPFDAFPTRDGWVTIAAPGERHWGYLCDIIGRPELGTDPGYATNAARVQRANEVRQIVRDWTTSQTTAEVVEVLGGIVPCGPINTVEDILADPHVARRQMIAHVEQPGSGTPVAIANSPVKMTETPGTVRRRAPLLGEHTDDVLLGLGFGEAAIAALRSQGRIL